MESAKKLGYQILKPHQEEAIAEFVSGKDVLMTLATGYGKSLCYQSLPLVYDEGRTILVAILFQFLLSLDDFVNPQHKHFYVVHSTMILHCYVSRYIMCQYGFVHNSCTCSLPDLLHTRSPHPSREDLAPRLNLSTCVGR